MGYFANGTEWEFYYAAWCDLCTHDQKSRETEAGEDGCPIIKIHYLASVDRGNSELQWACNLLIPVNGIENLNCTMFNPIKKAEENGTDRN